MAWRLARSHGIGLASRIPKELGHLALHHLRYAMSKGWWHCGTELLVAFASIKTALDDMVPLLEDSAHGILDGKEPRMSPRAISRETLQGPMEGCDLLESKGLRW